MNGRTALLAQLRAYSPAGEHETRMRAQMIAFVEAHPGCFQRSLREGRLTAPAWVLDREREHALLLHHGKLDKWLPPGGHCDGDADGLAVALREAREETGLTTLRAVSERIFDVDNHAIPARGAEPAHIHYDVRFLLEAGRAEAVVLSGESRELAWVGRDEVQRLTSEESVLRLVRKASRLCGLSR